MQRDLDKEEHKLLGKDVARVKKENAQLRNMVRDLTSKLKYGTSRPSSHIGSSPNNAGDESEEEIVEIEDTEKKQIEKEKDGSGKDEEEEGSEEGKDIVRRDFVRPWSGNSEGPPSSRSKTPTQGCISFLPPPPISYSRVVRSTGDPKDA